MKTTAQRIEAGAAAAKPNAISLIELGVPATTAIEVAALLAVFIDANETKIAQALAAGESPEDMRAELFAAFEAFAVSAAAKRRS